MEPSRTTSCNAAIVFNENLPEPGTCIIIIRSHRYRLFLQPFLDKPAIKLEDVTTPDLFYSCKLPSSLVTRPTLLKDFALEFLKSHAIDVDACEELAERIESLVNETSPVEEEEFVIMARADVDEIDVIDPEKAIAWFPSFSKDLAV